MAQFGEKKERVKRSQGPGARMGRAFLGALAVLVLAVLTWSALFLAPPGFHLRFDAANAPAWFAAIVSSFSIVAYYLLHRQRNSHAMEEISTRLHKGPRSRGEIAKQHVDLDLKASNFAERYGRMAGGTDEIMLICREVPAKGDKTYSTDEIREQIKFLKSSSLRQRVKWAVFVTNENEFVAFQNFDTFLAFVLNEQALRYRDALNMRDTGAFKSAFITMTREEAEKAYSPDGPAPDANVTIFGLNTYCVEQGWSRQRMIQFMDEKEIDEAMVVAKNRPVGVVRRTDLVNSILGAVL